MKLFSRRSGVLLAVFLAVVAAGQSQTQAAVESNDESFQEQTEVLVHQRRVLFSIDEHPDEVVYQGDQGDQNPNNEGQHEVEYPRLTTSKQLTPIIADLIHEARFHPGYGEEIYDPILRKKMVTIYVTPDLSEDAFRDVPARVIVLRELVKLLEGRISQIEQILRSEFGKPKRRPLPQPYLRRKAREQRESIRLAKQKIMEQKTESARLIREASTYHTLAKDMTQFRKYLENWYSNNWVSNHLSQSDYY